MITIILKNKNLIKLFKFSVKLFKFMNKYLYILSIISILNRIYATVKENKFYKVISWTIKIFLYVNLIVGTGFILYFTDFSNPFNNTFSFYYDIFKPYFDFFKQFWNDLLNINIEDSFSSKVKESNNIKTQIKEGIKQGVKEALDELLDEMNESNNNSTNESLKQIALISSVLFFGYFLFYLPGSSITPEELTQFNWMNQSLIEFKITVKDFIVSLFSNPVNPGNPGNNNNGVDLINSPISPTNNEGQMNLYFTNSTSSISPSNSVMSEGVSTVTPNTPKVTNIKI